MLKRTEIIEHNIKALLFHSEDQVLSANSAGKLIPISKNNYLKRLISWILDPKGLKVQNAVLGMLKVMEEEFDNHIKTPYDFYIRTRVTEPPKLKCALKINFNGSLPESLKNYIGSVKVQSCYSPDKTGRDHNEQHVEVTYTYPELASIIKSIPLFSQNRDIHTQFLLFRNKAIDKGIAVTQ